MHTLSVVNILKDLFINTSLPNLILFLKSVLNSYNTCTELSILLPVIFDKIVQTISCILYT